MIQLFEVILAYRGRVPSIEDADKYLSALRMHLEMEYPQRADRANL
jgi:hypothetical protein